MGASFKGAVPGRCEAWLLSIGVVTTIERE